MTALILIILVSLAFAETVIHHRQMGSLPHSSKPLAQI
jgi:hypothetical protein